QSSLPQLRTPIPRRLLPITQRPTPNPGIMIEGNTTMVHEEVELAGHIIDSLLLPKVLDAITARGGTFELAELVIGKRREEPSRARITIEAPDERELEAILARIRPHG